MRFLPALALAALLTGCSAASITRPEPPEAWDKAAVPAPEAIPWSVLVFQRVDIFSVVQGSGSIVHSSAEHGTIVLTSLHCVDDPEDPMGVWLYTDRGLETVEADVVFPKHKDMLSNLMATVFGNDFALLKLRDPRIFPTVPIVAEDLKEIPEKTDCELVALAPEGWPHRHKFQWAFVLPNEVVQEGHSGAPVLVGGRLAGIFGTVLKGTTSPMMNPTVGTMRERLREDKMEWALQPR